MFISLVDQFKAKVVKPEIDRRMNAAGAAWVEEARRTCPVDSGYMRSTIGYTYNSTTMELLLHVDASYFLFVEMGTARMPPRPFARNAVRVIGAVWAGSVTIQAVNTPEKYQEKIKNYKYRLRKGVHLQVGHKRHHR